MTLGRKSGLLLPGGLVAGSLLLAAGLYGALSVTPPAPQSGNKPLVQETILSEESIGPGFNMPPATDFVEIVQRPIFSPTRRPAPEGEATLDTVASELDLKLVGVIIFSGEPIAIVAPKNSSAFVRLIQGDRFQGWTVDRIEPQRVTFRRDTMVEHLELSYDQPPSKRRAVSVPKTEQNAEKKEKE